jgi:recombinational DNA repair ATPase RecF
MQSDPILTHSASAAELRSRIVALEMERLEAIEAGLGSNAVYMDDLESELGNHRNAYVGMAVTEIATLRGQLDGPLVG